MTLETTSPFGTPPPPPPSSGNGPALGTAPNVRFASQPPGELPRTYLAHARLTTDGGRGADAARPFGKAKAALQRYRRWTNAMWESGRAAPWRRADQRRAERCPAMQRSRSSETSAGPDAPRGMSAGQRIAGASCRGATGSGHAMDTGYANRAAPGTSLWPPIEEPRRSLWPTSRGSPARRGRRQGARCGQPSFMMARLFASDKCRRVRCSPLLARWLRFPEAPR